MILRLLLFALATDLEGGEIPGFGEILRLLALELSGKGGGNRGSGKNLCRNARS